MYFQKKKKEYKTRNGKFLAYIKFDSREKFKKNSLNF